MVLCPTGFTQDVLTDGSHMLPKTYVLVKLRSSKPSWIKFPFSLVYPSSLSLLPIPPGMTLLEPCGQAMASVADSALMAFMWKRKRTGIPSRKHFSSIKSVYYFFGRSLVVYPGD